MILVRMRDKNVRKARKVKIILESVRVGIGTEVHEQIVIDKKLRASAYLSSLLASCKSAYLTVTEYARNALCRGCSPILNLHIASDVIR